MHGHKLNSRWDFFLHGTQCPLSHVCSCSHSAATELRIEDTIFWTSLSVMSMHYNECKRKLGFVLTVKYVSLSSLQGIEPALLVWFFLATFFKVLLASNWKDVLWVQTVATIRDRPSLMSMPYNELKKQILRWVQNSMFFVKSHCRVTRVKKKTHFAVICDKI